MVQINVAITTTQEFLMIEEASVSDIFSRIIYTTVSKLLAIISIIVKIFDSDATRHVSGDWTRFPNLIIYDDFCCIVSEKQLAIKGKKNFDLVVRDTILRLSNLLYILGLTVNLLILENSGIIKLKFNSLLDVLQNFLSI